MPLHPPPFTPMRNVLAASKPGSFINLLISAIAEAVKLTGAWMDVCICRIFHKVTPSCLRGKNKGFRKQENVAASLLNLLQMLPMPLLELNLQLSILIAACFAFFIVMAWMLAEFKGMKDEIRERTGINNETLKLRLQAYERLTLFAERAGLKNMIARSSFTGQAAASLHHELIETIKSEYEYNVSQQIYVSPEIWNAVTKLKDQNIYIIN